MSHITIIINAVSPLPPSAAEHDHEQPFNVTVEYRPADGMTSSQIGNEVARIQRRVNQIIEGTAD